eukprot:NODE_1001_length_2191_cov_13.389265_g855_i0.p1 GENE.NODE_1001_length_2191_cov_13.389265_g855_i0~~NODE_1001_length_2191_cov_13.389265_g855_i0.p1  ORF type:complete len:702 (+),score=80.53 NODE_1001_length_2191_cov_13.389265_g855_i0:236-2107(+)
MGNILGCIQIIVVTFWSRFNYYKYKYSLYQKHVRVLLLSKKKLSEFGVHQNIITKNEDQIDSPRNSTPEDDINIQTPLSYRIRIQIEHFFSSLWKKLTTKDEELLTSKKYIINSRFDTFLYPMRFVIALIMAFLVSTTLTVVTVQIYGIFLNTLPAWFSNNNLDSPNLIAYCQRLFRIMISFTVIIAIPLPVIQLYFLRKRFRKEVIELRTTEISGLYLLATPMNAIFFPAFLMIDALSGTLLLLIVGLLISVFIWVLTLPNVLVSILTSEVVYTFIILFIIKKILFLLIPRLLFDKTRTRIMKRQTFGVIDYVLTIYSLPASIVNIIWFLISPLVYRLLFLCRPDIKTSILGIEKLDAGHTAYAAVVAIHALHGNPVVYLFCELVCDHIERMRYNKPNARCESQMTVVGKPKPSSTNPFSFWIRIKTHLYRTNQPPRERNYKEPFNRVSFYFWLLITLNNNPTLCELRKNIISKVFKQGQVNYKQLLVWKKYNMVLLKNKINLYDIDNGDFELQISLDNTIISTNKQYKRRFTVNHLNKKSYLFHVETIEERDNWVHSIAELCFELENNSFMGTHDKPNKIDQLTPTHITDSYVETDEISIELQERYHYPNHTPYNIQYRNV